MQGIELMELIYPSFKESVGTVTVIDDKTLTQYILEGEYFGSWNWDVQGSESQ